MKSFRTPPPGGGSTNSYHYETLINQQAKKLEDMEKCCIELKNEIALLKAENQNLKSNKTISKKHDINIAYETDEDELARETDWILKKRPTKKRKAELSPELSPEALGPTISRDLPDALGDQPEKRAPRPPPIMISEECEYQKIYSIAKNEAKKSFSIKLLNNNVYKINASDSDDYRKLTKALTTMNLSWYSYENKQSRPIKVMVKNLHHSNDAKAIVADLQEQGLKATNAVNKLKWKSKEPLDMFLLTFDESESIKKIYEIKTILHSVVKIEAVKQSKLIPQCKSCQSYGHTQNYCGKQPRCVKCTGKHKTIDCNKPEELQPKCCNCGEAHPASYRGCVVAKELQKIRDQRSGNKKSDIKNKDINAKKPAIKPTENNPKISARNPTLQKTASITNGPTYCQIVKGNDHSEDTNILQQILEKLTKQNEFTLALEKRLLKLEKIFAQTK